MKTTLYQPTPEDRERWKNQYYRGLLDIVATVKMPQTESAKTVNNSALFPTPTINDFIEAAESAKKYHSGRLKLNKSDMDALKRLANEMNGGLYPVNKSADQHSDTPPTFFGARIFVREDALPVSAFRCIRVPPLGLDQTKINRHHPVDDR